MKTILCCQLLFLFIQQGFTQCYPDRHSTKLTDAWISCEKRINPNPEREASHWILYDFAQIEILGKSHFWNINTPGHTSSGARLVAVDYSYDGSHWETWDYIELQKAHGSGFYEGEAGPDFNGLQARFLLLSILENYGSDCAGLAEVRFETLQSTSLNDIEIADALQMQIQPNPANQFTMAIIESSYNTRVQLRLLSSDGRTVFQSQYSLTQGRNEITVPLEDYPSGAYMLIIENDQTRKYAQLSIIK